MIGKGKISTVENDGAIVTVVPSYSDTPVTPRLTVPDTLVGLLSVGMDVAYAQFRDNTGIVLCRMDGKTNCSNVSE